MAPPNWATLDIDPASLIYPWQRSDYSHHLTLESREKITLARLSLSSKQGEISKAILIMRRYANAKKLPLKEAFLGNSALKSKTNTLSDSQITPSPFDVQNERTVQLAPVLAQAIKTEANRDEQGEYSVQRQDYLVRWNPSHRLLSVSSSQEREPLLQARYDDAAKTWNSIPLTQSISGEVQPRLSADDVERLQRSQLSYAQLFEQFSNNVPKSNSRELLICVAQAALDRGYSSQETLKIIEASPFHQRVGQKLEEKEAQKFLNQIVDIAAYQQQHGQLSQAEQLKRKFGRQL